MSGEKSVENAVKLPDIKQLVELHQRAIKAESVVGAALASDALRIAARAEGAAAEARMLAMMADLL